MRLLQCQNELMLQFGEDLELLQPQIRHQLLQPGQILGEPGDPIRNIYFPHGGMISRMVVFEDGTEIEALLIGRQGLLGGTAILGLSGTVTRDLCHFECVASVIDAKALREVAAKSARIYATLRRHTSWMMSLAVRNGACNARHPVAPRLARWLLQCADVLGQDELRLPQEVYAKMIGAGRTAVNPILQRFREEGLIELGREYLRLVDRPGLISRTCECYLAMKSVEAADPPDAQRRPFRPTP